MKFDEISCYATVNATDGAKVAELAESMKENGWKRPPSSCATWASSPDRTASPRSRRSTPMRNTTERFLRGRCRRRDRRDQRLLRARGIGFEEIQFDNLRDVFAGTWVEEYKDEIVEW